MKKSFYYLLSLSILIISCNSSNVDLQGDFVKVESKNIESGVYTFDFNTTLKIEKNGENFLITEGKGNKLPATIDRGILKINEDCSILVDETENVLVRTCIVGSSSNSEDFWPRKKAEEYISSFQTKENLAEYINNTVFDLYDKDYTIPTTEDLEEYEISFMQDSLEKKNNYYPFLCTGDFNGDQKFPDIAVIVMDKTDGNINSCCNKKLLVFHSGQSKPSSIEDFFCPWIETESNRKLDSYWEKDVIKKKSDGIVSVCLEKSAKVFVWNGYKYKEYWVSD